MAARAQRPPSATWESYHIARAPHFARSLAMSEGCGLRGAFGSKESRHLAMLSPGRPCTGADAARIFSNDVGLRAAKLGCAIVCVSKTSFWGLGVPGSNPGAPTKKPVKLSFLACALRALRGQWGTNPKFFPQCSHDVRARREVAESGKAKDEMSNRSDDPRPQPAITMVGVKRPACSNSAKKWRSYTRRQRGCTG